MSGLTPWHVGTLIDAVPLNPKARSITFEVPDWRGNLAGQHLDVRLTAPDGYQAVRSYSIASSGPGTRVELAIDKLPDGEVSPFLVDGLEIGDSVELRGPLGGWFVWTEELHVPIQLIAGGSGVVPFIAMARRHKLTGSTIPMHLLYSLRGPNDAFYREELALLNEDVDVTWHYTRVAPQGWGAEPRRLTHSDLKAALLPPEGDTRVYICGPTEFVETVAEALGDLGYPSESIRTERFGGT
ncbi:FAD-binding oxidoreductase [Diaminobutyricibacter tongyongensis]|uniref:FAD-binding oxidoreductase n=1 Tax=Leifsonia tongyongensis TaxID=1268043 RepID=UPI00308445DB